MPVELDESTWPIATLRVRGSLSREEEDEFTTISVSFPSRQERYVAVIDLLEAATPSPRFVRTQAEAQKEHLEGLRAYCTGVAFVIGSPMLRGALRAILYIQGLPCPHVVVSTVEDAQRWASSMLEHVYP